jgi:hypothetical protein
LDGGQVLNPFPSNQASSLWQKRRIFFLNGQFSRNHGNQLFSGLLQVLTGYLFQGHVSKFGFEDGLDIGTSAMPGRDADDIASRAVALLERTDAGKRPVRLMGTGVHGLLLDRRPDPS